jgi:hypothetical protein
MSRRSCTKPSLTSQSRIREEIPDLSDRVNALMADPPFSPFGEEDAKTVALVEWFKRDYMRWVDPILCPTCSGPTRSLGSTAPNDQDLSGGAQRVELHQCTAEPSHPARRFARYNDLMTLVRTREGRCGTLISRLKPKFSCVRRVCARILLLPWRFRARRPVRLEQV